MNEATFEARAQEAIKDIFPSYATLELTHQLIFSVKLGHEDINVKPSTKKPRLDILIKKNERNLAVLELKRPGHLLKDEDRDQGLSYARLLTPMPPLVIVSNGKETQFYETASGELSDTKNYDAEELEKLFVRALEIAASQREEAIRILLGKDPLIWEKVIGELNQISFQNQLGPIESLSQPIAQSFTLPRSITQRIVKLVSGNNPVIAVTGAPLVGKTNVLYEVCNLKEVSFVPIYINAENCQSGIFQYLANHFTKHFFSTTTIDDVRHWLLHGIVNTPHPAGKIVIIIDDVRYSEDHITREINELIGLCSSTLSCSIVIACDSSNYNLMADVPGRPRKTLFGKRALRVEVNNLSDVEFDVAGEYIKKNWAADFHKGAQYSRELRNPRILRMIIANLPQELNVDTRLLIPSFLPFRALDWVLRGFSNDHKFISDMVKLVKASMENNQDSPPPILESMVSYGRGHVLYDKAENLLGEARIVRLLQQGHIDWFTDKENNRYIFPKVPELLAASAVEILVIEARRMEFEQAIDYVLKKSERLPYGDIIGANVFDRLSCEGKFSLYELIVYLIKKPPEIEKVTKNFHGAMMYFDKTGLVTIPPEIWQDASEEIKMISNLFPWLLLSQLATELMIAEDNEDPWKVYREILIVVGGYQNVLRRFEPESTLDDIKGYQTHTLRSKDGREAEVLCGEVGIIEPITYAMQRGFYDIPDEMLKICQYAVQKKDPFLSHRLHNAANSMIDVDNEASARSIRLALKMLKEVY
ncbi:type I restriction endonuclease [Bacillus cereus]